jgi:ribosome-associated protein
MTDSHIVILNSIRIPVSELEFRTSRSGGPGGQNVNKLETRVELIFDIKNSKSLTDSIRLRLLEKLGTKIDSEGKLRIITRESRSQWQNKKIALEKFTSLIRSGLSRNKRRIPTKSTKMAKEERLRRKKKRGEIKKLRKREYTE